MRFSFPARTPGFLRKLLPGMHFTIETSEQIAYLTFDDGPVNLHCQWILECLRQHNAKASFFLVGDNVLKHPELVRSILEDGHTIGNHTQNHLNGFQTPTPDYLKNVERCQEALSAFLPEDMPKMFRPPYGKLLPAQFKAIKRLGYEIVMWDVLSKDYDQNLGAEDVCNNVIPNTKPGSILVFHDNIKAEKSLKEALPKILSELAGKGFRFEALKFPERKS